MTIYWSAKSMPEFRDLEPSERRRLWRRCYWKALRYPRAMLGVGMFVLPIGIIGAGSVEAVQKKKGRQVCPHCGKELD